MERIDNQAFDSYISTLVDTDRIREALDALREGAKILSDEELDQEVVLISNKWNRLKKEKNAKTIRVEEAEVRYNQICVSILGLADELSALANEKQISLDTQTNLSSPPIPPSKSSRKMAAYGGSIGGLFLLIIPIVFFLKSQKEVACPFSEEGTKYNILLIPFEEMGLQSQNSHASGDVTLAVQNRFEAMQVNGKLPLDVRIDKKTKLKAQKLNQTNASKYANKCRADLLLSGLFEQTQGVNIDSLVITFKYLAVGREESDSMFTISGMERHAVASLSSLIHGSFPGKIEDIIYWALGLKEFEAENYAGALQHFEAIHPQNESSHIKVELAKAEVIQRIGNYRDAFRRYEQLAIQETKLDRAQKTVIFNNMAALAIELDQPDIAARKMREALDLNEDNTVLKQNFRMIQEIHRSDSGEISSTSEVSSSIQILTSTRTISEKADEELMAEELTSKDTLSRIETDSQTREEIPTPQQSLAEGIKARKEKNYQSAIQHLTHAIEQAPDQYLAYLEMGYVFAQLGKKKKALENYNQAIKLYPLSPDAFLRRGQLFRQMGRYQDAIADFEQLKKLGKKQEAFTQIAFVYYERKAYQQAISMLDQALLLSPRNQDLLNFSRLLKQKAAQQVNH